MIGKHYRNYLESMRAQGIAAFSTDRLKQDLARSETAVSLALYRLRREGRIATPVAGYHVIVPPEYRSLGCLPAEQFLDGLMEHLGEPYYVALLSAAEIHGAAHQRPQVFQVMVAKKRKAIECGKVRIEFNVRRNLSEVPYVKHKVSTGYLKVSSPEATALDLVGYMRRCAGLDNVATVLAELDEVLELSKLARAAEASPVAWAQRLGCLLQMVGREDKITGLAKFVKEHANKVVGLVAGKDITGVPRMNPWKVAINEQPEPEI